MRDTFNNLFSEYKHAWRKIFDLADKFEDIFKFRFECEETGIKITPEILQNDRFLVAHLVLSTADYESGNSIIVLETLIKERNKIFEFFFPDRQNEKDKKFGKLRKQDLKLPNQDTLTELVFTHGMHRTQFKRQQQVLFDYKAINAELMARLEKRFEAIPWKREERHMFEYFDEIATWSQILEKFHSKMTINKLTNEAENKLKKVLVKDASSRFEVLLSCGYFLRQNWPIEDYDKKVQALVEQNNILLLTRYKDISKLKLKYLLFVFEELELSLFQFFFHTRIPDFYKQNLSVETTLKIQRWLKSVEVQFIDSMVRALVNLISRHHSVFEKDFGDLPFGDFLSYCSGMSIVEAKGEKLGLFQLFKDCDLKARHFYGVFQLSFHFLGK